MMSSRVGERRVPPWMTVTAPAVTATPVPEATAGRSMRKVLASTTCVTRAPAGRPVPETGMPGMRPAVLATLTEREPKVVAPLVRLRFVVAAAEVWRMPPEITLRIPPSGMDRSEEPAALKRTLMGETTLSSEPAYPVASVMFSPLSTPASVSREAMVTGTILVPTRVAKLVAPEASETVTAAPRVPTSPVKRSLPVEVVMPLTALCTPEGKVRRTVPPSRCVIGPRLRTRLRPPAEKRSREE